MYRIYSPLIVMARRSIVLLLTMFLLPLLWALPNGRRLSSRLHRAWVKQGEQPVWMMEAERSVNSTFF